MENLEKEEKVKQIIQYLSGESSGEEVIALKNWVIESKNNKEFYFRVKNIWEVTQKSEVLTDNAVHTALDSVLARLPKIKQSHSFWFHWQKIAAILIIPIVLGSLIWIFYLLSARNSNVTYNEVFASFGTRSALKLSDGSLVWLNSGSKLSYPDKFIRKERIVYLTGEAYFEVSSDKSHPFIVRTTHLDVKATGTKFNVSAYKRDQKPYVTLLEGKVFVTSSSNNGRGKITEMKANQYLTFDTLSGNISVAEKDYLYKYIAWKDGKLVFRNEPLKEVARKISQFYNVEIEIKGKELAEYPYRATFKEESLVEILKLLKLSSPIDYIELERKPQSDGTYPKRKIILFPAK